MKNKKHALEGDEHGFVWYCTDYTIGGTIEVYHQGYLDLDGLPGTIAVCYRLEDGACAEWAIPWRYWLSCEDFTANERMALERMLINNERIIMDTVRGLI